jgi:bacteriorhodopsin
VIWILGPSGIGLFSQAIDTLLFVLVPIVSKVGWSIVDLTSLRALNAPAA